MRARMSISNLAVPAEGIQSKGGLNSTAAAGHEFDLTFQIKVEPRTLGTFSDEIECPTLEWNERIEWFEYNMIASEWFFKGAVTDNMYQRNPQSNTFKRWHAYRYLIAADSTNHPPKGLAGAQSDDEARRWIAKNGFTWNLAIRDIPAMGVNGGYSGGGGASLLTGNTRRRVIYFDLGFSGHPERVQLVQILETVHGKLTLHRLFRTGLQKATVDLPSNLAHWRFQLNSSVTAQWT